MGTIAILMGCLHTVGTAPHNLPQLFRKQPRDALAKSIKKKQDDGYYRYGRGAIPILRQGAAKRGIGFDITPDELERWWMTTPDVCEYCGIELDDYLRLRDFVLMYDGLSWEILKFKRFFRSSKHAKIRWMTIDRKNNTEGYNLANIAKACWFCNSLKSDFFEASEMRTIAPSLISRLKTAIEKEQ